MAMKRSFTLLLWWSCFAILTPGFAWAGGWYLLIAPFRETFDHSLAPDNKAPLEDWDRKRSYDSAAECEQDLRVTRNAFSEGLRKLHPTDTTRQLLLEAQWTTGVQCIATNDPRLK